MAVIEGGNLYYVRADHIGRPVFATDGTGTKVWELSYLPFGGVETITGSPMELRFPGQWYQSESGLHQNWMREYDPTTGRYLQGDPLGLVDGASVYGYALQSPGRYTDKYGLLVELILYQNPNKKLNELQCSCGESYYVFSGNDEHRNNPLSQSIPNDGPIPHGTYYIVDRPTGGRNPFPRFWAWYRGKNEWFGLYRQDGKIDDYTVLSNGTSRGNFRMHPGTLSLGCVTFDKNAGNYDDFRQTILSTSTAIIPGTDITYYGTLTVRHGNQNPAPR